MKVAELFINIGVKGDGKTKNVLIDINKGLGQTASSGLAAKAAIIGAVYAMERLAHQSMVAGNNIVNFNALTNISGQNLQAWQYGFRMAGASAEEASDNFKTLQTQMGKMALNKGIPEGLSLMGQMLGGLDYNRMKTDIVYLLEKGRDFAKATAGKPNVAAYNEILRGVGFTDNMIAASRRGLLDQNILSQAKRFSYSDGQAKNLEAVNQQWTRFQMTLEKAFGDFNSKHGSDLIGNLSKLTEQVLKLVDSLLALAEVLKVFPAITAVTSTLAGTTSEGAKTIKDISKGKFKSAFGHLIESGKPLGEVLVNPQAFSRLLDTSKPGGNVSTQVNHVHVASPKDASDFIDAKTQRQNRHALPKRNQKN